MVDEHDNDYDEKVGYMSAAVGALSLSAVGALSAAAARSAAALIAAGSVGCLLASVVPTKLACSPALH